MRVKSVVLGLVAAVSLVVRGGNVAASGDTTGVTDTTAIQNALNAAIVAAGANGSVVLGSGTFYLNATLSLSNGVTLRGQGMDKTVIRPRSSLMKLSAGSGDLRRLSAGSGDFNCLTLEGGAKLEGVTVTGGKTGDGAGVKVVDGTISWCTIADNSGSCGGGVCFSNGKGQIDHSIVKGNSASGAGGGIGMTGLAGNVVIDTCLVYGNTSTAGSGGGVAVVTGNSKTVTIRNSTITGNATRYNGGGIHLKSADAVLLNCIFAGNSPATGGGVAGYANLPDLTVEGSSTTGSDYCFFGTSQEVVGSHSVSGTAPFIGSGDYHLSAAKELGYTDTTGTCVDLDNVFRSGSLDVGCYEFGGSAPTPTHTHVWSVTGYSWAADYSTCTASATCTGDASHKTNVTVTATYKVTKEPTTEATGTGTYTATFTAPFATQTKNVTLDKLPKEEPPHVDPTDAVTPSGDTTGVQDAKAIQDLIDAAAPTHGSVVLGSGVFLLDRQLMITNGVTLVGQSWSVTVLKPASGKNIRLATLDGGATLEKVTLTGGRFEYGAGAWVKDGTVSWCCISNNVMTGLNKYGAGVSFTEGRGQIDHSIIAGNSQTQQAFGAGIGMKSQAGSIVIDTCLIYGNDCSMGSGGGVMAESIGSGKSVQLSHCTVTGNTTRYNAGGFHVKNGDNGTCVMLNNILSGNTGGSNAVNKPDLTLENAFATGTAYNLFGTADEAVGSNYVIGAAPFVGGGDYRLSEAKELGFDTDDPMCVDLDYNGRHGFLDVGCYEFGGSAYVECPGATLYVD